MRLGSLLGMEIIDLADASRLGRVAEVDAEVDAAAGRLTGLRLLVRRGLLWGRPTLIAWESVRRIGADLLIVDLSSPGKSSYPRRLLAGAVSIHGE